MSVRVRFAPQSHRLLHIGGARTGAVQLAVRAATTGGSFVLRIEDTDAARNTQEATEVILSGLRWLGLNWATKGRRAAIRPGASVGDYGPSYFQIAAR